MEVGTALVTIAEKLDEAFFHRIPFITKYIIEKKLINPHQIDSVVEFIKTKGSDIPIDVKEFESTVGIGVVISETDIQNSINKHLEQRKRQLDVERYKFKYTLIIPEIKKDFAYLDSKITKELLIKTIEKILGPKTKEEIEEDNLRAEHDKLKDKKKAIRDSEKKNKKAKEAKEVEKWNEEEEKRLEELKAVIKKYDEEFERKLSDANLTEVVESEKDKLSKLIARDMSSALNSDSIIKKHLEFTKGKVFTRFPPEPNGFLHIGHAKAMRFNFTSASKNGGSCYLRFDDTNPEKETKEFIDNIKENVNWLGYTPFKITYASDYFEDLYDLAVELIKRGKAYVCNLTKEEVAKDREAMKDSPYRNRSVEENLDLFKKMREGRFEEKACCLRMKIDMKHPNPVMRDPVAYRIKYVPHPHAGDKWCIYPTYDYTHCINDSLENITHSLCTLEFEIRRDGYYWLLEALDIYRPFVWEYSRLNITNFVLSKRRLTLMVDQKIVNGWDDPRMPTINGLRRRGYTSEAINNFVDTIGVTRRGNENFVSHKLLEHHIKLDLDKKAPRTMGVVDPLLINLVNLTEPLKIKTPLFPKDPSKGEKEITLGKKIYIERADFQEKASSDYFGLTLEQEVGLKYSGYLKVLKVNKDVNGKVESVDCNFINESKKTKGRIHWISDEDKMRVEVRWFENLFLSENPNALENWLDDLNPKSLTIFRDSFINKNLLGSDLKHLSLFQFERVGYFVVDFDSVFSNNYIVMNLTTTLN